MKHEFNITGFLDDASFSAHTYEFLDKWNDQFPGLEELTLEIQELYYYDLANSGKHKEWYQLSPDRKKLKIVYSYHKWYDAKGKVTGQPEPHNVYYDLNELFKIAVKRYSEVID